LDLGRSPIADAYTARHDEVSPTYPLELAVCGKCRLVQLLEVLDDMTLFGTGYSFYSSASPPLSAYHAGYAADIRSRYGDLAQRGVVEVGCNDGDLLRHFADCPSLGIDPAAGPGLVAQERGLNIVPNAFGTALQVWHDIKPPGVLIANHVLAHVPDVHDFLVGLERLVAGDGIVMVEVQYLPDLLVNNAFDLVYHEHRNFFSLTSLEQAAKRAGLHVVDAELTARQGGSLRVTLAKTPLPNPRVDALRSSEAWLQDWGPYAGFQGRVDRIRTRLLGHLHAEYEAGHLIVGYGAPAKATTLLNYCGISDSLVSWVVDSTPAKQGRFIPGTGLQILRPEPGNEPADTYLCLAWNYAAEIMRKNIAFTAAEGRWLLPIPAPVLL
jgi:novobiocin biosynthesis protein NovU/D-mycarose 3-C-methyltransferase